MFLILEEHPTEFSSRLQSVAERKGLQTLLLTGDKIAHNLSLAFFISKEKIKLKFSIYGSTFEDTDLNGVYCGINAFGPELWKNFSAEDSKYAAQETQALWLAILSSLPCRVVNPPALDTLAGTVLSAPEILHLARNLGFKIATTVTVESGKVAAELLENNASAVYTDLGEEWLTETKLNKNDRSLSMRRNENHYRITEQAPGKLVHVTLVGKKFLACAMDNVGSIVPIDFDQMPFSARTKLRTIQKRLNLNLAEYHFRVTNDGAWIFSGMSRPPTFSTIAFGDVLFEQIIDFLNTREKSHGNPGLRS